MADLVKEAFASITAKDLMTPLHEGDVQHLDIATLGLQPRAWSPELAEDPPLIGDIDSYQNALIEHLLTGTRVDFPSPGSREFLKPYVSVSSCTPLPRLLGDENLAVPKHNDENKCVFWVVVDADKRPIGTLASANLLQVPGTVYLAYLVVQFEQALCDYLYNEPHAFDRLTQPRREKTALKSMSDRRWTQLLGRECEAVHDDIRVFAEAAASSGRHNPAEKAASARQLVESLNNHNEGQDSRKFALRLLLDSTELCDRVTLVNTSLRTQKPPEELRTIHRAGKAALKVRNRLFHPWTSFATDFERFTDYREADAHTIEQLDEGMTVPLWQSPEETFGFEESIASLREAVVSLIKAQQILRTSG